MVLAHHRTETGFRPISTGPTFRLNTQGGASTGRSEWIAPMAILQEFPSRLGETVRDPTTRRRAPVAMRMGTDCRTENGTDWRTGGEVVEFRMWVRLTAIVQSLSSPCGGRSESSRSSSCSWWRSPSRAIHRSPSGHTGARLPNAPPWPATSEGWDLPTPRPAPSCLRRRAGVPTPPGRTSGHPGSSSVPRSSCSASRSSRGRTGDSRLPVGSSSRGSGIHHTSKGSCPFGLRCQQTPLAGINPIADAVRALVDGRATAPVRGD